MIKRISILLLSLLLLSFSVTVLAAENTTIDFSRTGSVSVTLKTGDTAIVGAELTLYRVADVQSKDGNLAFIFTENYAGFGGAPENIQNAEDILRLENYTRENSIAGESEKTDADGNIKFDNLSLGLYLAVQTGAAVGFSDCTPFLVMLPTEENGAWMYDIDATPKTDVARLIDLTVKKVWNDGKADTRPESVTVRLLKGETVIDTVTLNEQNGWSHTWEDVPESDLYSIKEKNVPKGYTASYQQNGYVFTITNTSTLIQTGQLIWPIPVLAVGGLVLFAVGLLLYRRNKKDA